jgi:hypothetical protein
MFDLQARTWVQLPIRGLSPLPRFLFASTQYSPDGGAADQFLLFGGQTGALRHLLLLATLHLCRHSLTPLLSGTAIAFPHSLHGIYRY